MTSKKNSDMDGDGVDLFLVFSAVRQHWQAFATCLVVALALAVLAYVLTPPRWSASAGLRIGAVAYYSVSDVPFSKLLESPPEVEAKVRLQNFAKAVLDAPSVRGMTSADVALYRKTVKAVAVRGTSLITVSAAGRTPDKARSVLEATIATLKSDHDEKMHQATQQMRDRLRQLNEEVAVRQADLSRLKQKLSEGGRLKSKSEYGDLLAQDLISRLEMELRDMEKSRFTLQSLLSVPLTYPTELVDPVTVGDKPGFPALRLFLMIALIAGSLLGVLLSVFFHQRRFTPARRLPDPSI